MKFHSNELKKAILDRRVRRNLTTRAAAKEAHVPASTFNDAEFGRVTKIEILISIVNWLGMPITKFIN